ncbi:nicotianamine synthase family protein [Paenibacillus gansuensis]|uniref:Nicotianamine synthase family protein n=1 Tax=Paenibacillus gansuensis TaxID=306542 RepID=A0ABW5P7Q3_9BACL
MMGVNTVRLQHKLTEYSNKFTALAQSYDGTKEHGLELENVLDHYAAFVTDSENLQAWAEIEEKHAAGLDGLADAVRAASAQCVANMEKYRAWRLLSGTDDRTGYFSNIESCIETEFGSFQITPNSKVLMIGSGSFPMTPLLIAKRTGAEVVGIDIDEEAIELGRKVVAVLGSGLNIRLEGASVEQLEITREATHIVFSSTVAGKYDLLDRLHAVTNSGVVVAMRYGNRLKSLFNYPMQEVNRGKWRLADHIQHAGHVFDIALYVKA